MRTTPVGSRRTRPRTGSRSSRPRSPLTRWRGSERAVLIAIASMKGSPGATSTSLALAAMWPRPVVLVEADPSGGDLAYRCKAAYGGLPYTDRSVLTLAAAMRDGLADPDAVA